MMRDEIQKRAFERLYEASYLKVSEEPPVSGIVEALMLKPDSVVAEFGAGQGHFTLPIAKKFAKSGGDGLIFAFEYSDRMIKTLDDAGAILGVDEHIRSWPLTQMKEPNQLPVNDGKIDRVLAVNSVQYLDDAKPIIREFWRVLRPGGFALIADWSQRPAKIDADASAQAPSAEDVISQLYRVGFAACTKLNMDGFEWVIRAVKPVSWE